MFFPEHVRFEDNYWGTMLRLYIKKITFVPSIQYYYVQHASSTIHLNNADFTYDRIELEKKLLAQAKEMGVFEKYKSAWEYIYIFRYAINTSYILLRFDKVPYNRIREIGADLNAEFPGWRKNPYYRERTSRKRRVMNWVLLRFPRFCRAMHLIKTRGRLGNG